MSKPIYEFENGVFRDQLAENYILPVAQWLLGPPELDCVLAQVAGSNWECALTLEFFARLQDSEISSADLVISAGREKLGSTLTWMLNQLEFSRDRTTASWDGNMWDTAVCAQAIANAAKADGGWGVLDGKDGSAGLSLAAVARWLCESFSGWGEVVRYVDEPADLAQALKAMILIHDSSLCSTLPKAERKRLRALLVGNIDALVSALLAHQAYTVQTLDDGSAEGGFWVDAMHTSEVVDSFAAYLRFRRGLSQNAQGEASVTPDDVRAAITRGMMHLEVTQRRGSWGGGEMTCGTLFWYLETVRSLQHLDHEVDVAVDHVVFRGIRWMCDPDQALSDGSFLHTTYVTVFYSLAIIEAYTTWDAGKKTTMQVYDLSLWDAIAINTSERGRRFQLEWQVRELEAERAAIVRRRGRVRARWIAALLAVALFSVIAVALMLAENISIEGRWPEISIHSADSGMTWAVLGVVVPIAVAAVGFVYQNTIKRADGTQ